MQIPVTVNHATAAAYSRVCVAAAQWDVVQLTVVLANILAKSAPYWRVLPPPWYLSVAAKAAALACMLARPRRRAPTRCLPACPAPFQRPFTLEPGVRGPTRCPPACPAPSQRPFTLEPGVRSPTRCLPACPAPFQRPFTLEPGVRSPTRCPPACPALFQRLFTLEPGVSAGLSALSTRWRCVVLPSVCPCRLVPEAAAVAPVTGWQPATLQQGLPRPLDTQHRRPMAPMSIRDGISPCVVLDLRSLP
jgi:hypothetical protein